MAVSESKLRSLHRKTSDKMITLTDRDGLYVRVSKAGKISFFMRYRFGGKADQLTIGTYPEMGLKNARDKNTRMRAYLLEGKNPKVELKLSLKSNEQQLTLSELANMWYESEVRNEKQTHKKIISIVKNHAVAQFGDLPASSITPHHFYQRFEEIKKKSPFILQQLISSLRQMYDFAFRRRLVSDNPIVGISAARHLNIHQNTVERVLDADEIKRLLIFCRNDGRSQIKKRLIIELVLIYGCRTGEMMLTKIEHWNLFTCVWELPPEFHKSGSKTKRSITRPIPKHCKRLMEELAKFSNDGVNLVTSNKGGGYKRPNWNTWPNDVNKWLVANGYEPIPKWGMHDLRRTMRTHMARHAPEVVLETMIGHSRGKTTHTYDHYDYIDEQKEAYEKWTELMNDYYLGEEKVSDIMTRYKKPST